MFSNFEHRLLDFFRAQNIKNQKLTVACSGGLDSIVLLYALARINIILKADLEVLYVHHGASSDFKKQSEYRDEALACVRAASEKLELSFYSEKSETFLKTEKDCRNFRREIFKNFKFIILAHHKDDLLETLVLRLIRGTGPQGLKEPFQSKLNKNTFLLRPFLNLFSKADILSYVDQKKIKWCEDPSNKEDDHLRNWVRNHWLKDLNEKAGTEGLVKSMELFSAGLSEATDDKISFVTFSSDLNSGSFNLKVWWGLSQFQKQSSIAAILQQVRKVGYTKGQIEEVVRRLDQKVKNTTFESGKIAWSKTEAKVEFRNLL